MLGGFVAARLAKEKELKHAGLVGVLSIVTGLLPHILGSSVREPLWYSAIAYMLTLPVAMLGGYFGKFLNLRRGLYQNKFPWETIVLLVSLGFFEFFSIASMILSSEIEFGIVISFLIYAAAIVAILTKKRWGLIVVGMVVAWNIIGGLLRIIFPNLPTTLTGFIVNIMWTSWWLFSALLVYRANKKLRTSLAQ